MKRPLRQSWFNWGFLINFFKIFLSSIKSRPCQFFKGRIFPKLLRMKLKKKLSFVNFPKNSSLYPFYVLKCVLMHNEHCRVLLCTNLRLGFPRWSSMKKCPHIRIRPKEAEMGLRGDYQDSLDSIINKYVFRIGYIFYRSRSLRTIDRPALQVSRPPRAERPAQHGEDGGVWGQGQSWPNEILPHFHWCRLGENTYTTRAEVIQLSLL